MKRLNILILATITAALGITACTDQEPTSSTEQAVWGEWWISTAADLATRINDCKAHGDCDLSAPATATWSALSGACTSWNGSSCQQVPGMSVAVDLWIGCSNSPGQSCCSTYNGVPGPIIYTMCCNTETGKCEDDNTGWYCGYGGRVC